MRKRVFLFIGWCCLLVIQARPQTANQSIEVMVFPKKGDSVYGRVIVGTFVKWQGNVIEVQHEGKILMIGVDSVNDISVTMNKFTGQSTISERMAEKDGGAQKSKQPIEVMVLLKKGDPVHGPVISGIFVKWENNVIEVQHEDKILVIGLDNVNDIYLGMNKSPAESVISEKFAEGDPEAAGAALKALKRMSISLEIGLSRRDYGNRLIDVKIAVEEAESKIASTSLRMKIHAALHDYENALYAWDAIIAYRTNSGGAGIVAPEKLRLLTKEYPDLKPFRPSLVLKDTEMLNDTETILSVIWNSARKHIDNASTIVGSLLK
jgi:transcription antitermination factor NusG